MAGAGLAAGALGIVGAGISAAISAKAARTSFKRAVKFRRSAYQDTVYSLRQAGLNPILAFGKGPVSGTTFGQARVPDFAQGIASSAIGVSKVRAELKLLEAAAGKADAEAMLAAGRAGVTLPQRKKLELEVKEFKPTPGGLARRFFESGGLDKAAKSLGALPNWIRERMQSVAESLKR